MKNWLKTNFSTFAWGVFALTTLISLVTWSQNGTNISSVYRLFPLLGLLAFSTMWGHYVVGAVRVYSGAESALTKTYSSFTHWFVFVCILLHPALFILQLKADGLGLPPESYKAYVGEALVKFVFLGTLCWLAFMLFEFKKWIQPKPQLWKIVIVLNHLAMLGIVLHAVKIGTDVRSTQLKYIFPFYGLSLIAIYIYLAYEKKLI